METVEIPIDKIVPYWHNPRKNDATVTRLCNSIKEYGFNVPLVLNKDYVVITGHARLKAAKQLGLASVPCVIVNLTDEQAKKYRIADNKIQELSEWDEDALLKELREIGGDIDILDLGFSAKEVEKYLGSVTTDVGSEVLGDADEGGVVISTMGIPVPAEEYVPRQVVEDKQEQIEKLQEQLKAREQELTNRFPQESYEQTKFDNLVVCPHCGESFRVRGLKPQ